jgi:hypothetical protein
MRKNKTFAKKLENQDQTEKISDFLFQSQSRLSIEALKKARSEEMKSLTQTFFAVQSKN